MSILLSKVIATIETGMIPDSLVRSGIRKLLRSRLQQNAQRDCEESQAELRRFIRDCDRSPIATASEESKEQHYEVPSEFFQRVLGSHLKYSCCHFEDGIEDLDSAEANALRLSCEHAELMDGQRVLELGCGWGSLSLWMAGQYPNSTFTAVSNSSTQRTFIETECLKRGIDNLTIVTSDINDFSTDLKYDRVVSVEMFEHVRNHRLLMNNVSRWLDHDGKLFVHIFCHRDQPYLFEDNGPQDWMTRYFFSGGMMPSRDLLLNYQDSLRIENQWCWNGSHYAKTCNAWLANQDSQADEILDLFAKTYGKSQASIWFQRWRIFFMACAELFDYRSGNEWFVSHYLFNKNS